MESAVLEETRSSTRDHFDPDLQLVESTRNGDIAAFEELVRRYDCRLLRIAQQVTNNLEDAQEAVQETFLKVFQKLDQFQGNSKFSTWLIRIALNESIMKIRRQRYKYEIPLEYESQDGEHTPMDVADWSPNPEQLYSRAELQEILRKALGGLLPAIRITFVLRDIEGLSIKETASVLGIEQTAVKSRLLRARLQLREKLSKHFKLPPTTQPDGGWPWRVSTSPLD
ncbi:MAG: sigma-70 family RNA polymerase sigma factor [Acidobacteria bacterium]|nr:sigma-70 family RNA polymerase sigma factor [Acidobacteriota bacterium]